MVNRKIRFMCSWGRRSQFGFGYWDERDSRVWKRDALDGIDMNNHTKIWGIGSRPRGVGEWLGVERHPRCSTEEVELLSVN